MKKLSKKIKVILVADVLLLVVLAGILAVGYSTGRFDPFGVSAEEQARIVAEQEEAERIKALEEAEAKKKQAEEAEKAQIEAELAEARRIAEEQEKAALKAEEDAAAEQKRLEEEAANRIHLCMGGDVLPANMINETCRLPEGGFDYNGLFANVVPYLDDYDLKIINEETACGGGEFGISGYPSFNSPHEVQDAIANAGFNCVCMATNHMLDFGPAPLYSTLDYWRNMYPWMATVGAYDSPEASEEIYCYEKNGFRIAILNYTYGSNAGSGAYYDDPTCLNMLYEDEVRSDIRRAKEISDYVIVAPHWGTEYLLGHDDEQAKWAQIFLEEGVDLVLGTHPHVPEPIEVFERGDGHSMICYYSLGNFISNQDYSDTIVAGLADVTLRKTPDGVLVEDYGLVPIVTHKAPHFTTYLLKDYNNDMAFSSYTMSLAPDFSWDYCVELMTYMYGDRLRKFYPEEESTEEVPVENADEAAPEEGEISE